MRTLLVAGIIAVLSNSIVSAGVGVWTTNGPASGGFFVLTDRSDPSVLYADGVSFDGMGAVRLNKSADNGATWGTIGNASCQAPFVTPLATAPPSTVYLAGEGTFEPGISSTSVVKSIDGGASCSGELFPPIINGGVVLALDADNPTEIYAATGGSAPFRVGRSVDGGTTWTQLDSGLPPLPSGIAAFVADPKKSGTLYLASGQSLIKSVDSGTSWLSLFNAVGSIDAVAVDPAKSSVIYLSGTSNLLQGGSGSVVKSTDGGVTFAQASAGLPTAEVTTLCINPRNTAQVFAIVTNQGVFESVDGGTSWLPFNSGLGDFTSSVSSLAIDPTGEYLHAGTGAGVFDYQLASPTCVTDTHTLCLNNGRFSVTADFQSTPEGPSSPATAVPLTSDTGYFWFFDPSNIELVTKVLDGCTVNGKYWVFASGLTNVGVQINVTDTVTGATKPYSNTFGTAFQPIQDTSAFPCP